MIVGFQSSANVEAGEDVGTVELCVVTLNPSIDETLDTDVVLIVDTMEGSAGA